MRACFLGQNICALGYGVATLQAPRLVMDQAVEDLPLVSKTDEPANQVSPKDAPTPLPSAVANSPLLCL
jgi:hypothetical protein